MSFWRTIAVVWGVSACGGAPPPAPPPPPPPAPAPKPPADVCGEFCAHQSGCVPDLVPQGPCLETCRTQLADAPKMRNCPAAFATEVACVEKVSCTDLRALLGPTPPNLCRAETESYEVWCSQDLPLVVQCLKECDDETSCTVACVKTGPATP